MTPLHPRLLLGALIAIAAGSPARGEPAPDPKPRVAAKEAVRTDRYGGDREARVRIVAEIVAAIRALESGIAVGARFSVEPGLDVDELAAIVSTLAQAVELDWVNVTAGPRGEYVKDMGTARPPLLGQFAPIREASRCPLVVSQAVRTRAEQPSTNSNAEQR